MSSHEGASSGRKARQVRRFEELSPPQVMALAVAIERGNARRFRAFAGMFHGYDEAVATRLTELAEEEDRHEEELRKQFAMHFGGEIPVIDERDVDVVIEAFDLDDAEQQIFDALDPQQVYQLALRAETLAHTFYDRAAKACADPALANVYRTLAEMEDGHVDWFENKLQPAKGRGA